MRILRIVSLAVGIPLALAGVIVLAAAFWLHLAASARPEPDTRVPLAVRAPRALPRPPKAVPRFRVQRLGDQHHIVDVDGRTAIFRGVTVGSPGDPPPHQPLGKVPRNALARLRDIGVNTVRIPVSWDSLETDDGGIDGARVRHLIDILRAARGLDMNVLLAADHVGIPGGLGARGLPDRSLRGGPLDLEPGSLGTTYDTLRQLPHRIRWWADFLDARWTWDDRALQDHLIDAWVQVASLLRADPALVGVSPLRRPECYPGLFGVLFNPARTSCGHAVADFQQRFFTALRTADPDAVAFLEPPASGIPWCPKTSGIDWTAPGIPGTSLLWTPPRAPGPRRLPPAELLSDAVSRATIADHALVFLDEHGIDASGQDDAPEAPSLEAWAEAMDATAVSGFFRLDDIENPPQDLIRALNRPTPLRIAGVPVAWSFKQDEFSLQFRQGEAAGTTRVRIPPAAFADGATWDDLDILVSDGRWAREVRDDNVIAWQTDSARDEHVLVVRLKARAGY
jgi:hypothetical protein